MDFEAPWPEPLGEGSSDTEETRVTLGEDTNPPTAGHESAVRSRAAAKAGPGGAERRTARPGGTISRCRRHLRRDQLQAGTAWRHPDYEYRAGAAFRSGEVGRGKAPGAAFRTTVLAVLALLSGARPVSHDPVHAEVQQGSISAGSSMVHTWTAMPALWHTRTKAGRRWVCPFAAPVLVRRRRPSGPEGTTLAARSAPRSSALRLWPGWVPIGPARDDRGRKAATSTLSTEAVRLRASRPARSLRVFSHLCSSGPRPGVQQFFQ